MSKKYINKQAIIVSTKVPEDKYSGANIRLSKLVEIIKENYDLQVILITNKNNFNAEAVKKALGHKNILIYTISKWSIIKNIIVFIFHFKPLQLALFYSNSVARILSKKTKNINLTLLHMIRPAYYVKDIKSKIKIMDMADLLSKHYLKKSINEKINYFLKGLFWYEAKTLRRVEKNLDEKFNLISFHNIQELKESNYDINKTIISSMGVENRNIKKSNSPPNKMLFIGKLDFPPNRLSIDFIANRILPLTNNKISLKIIGDYSNANVSSLIKNKRIQLLGKVNKIEDHTNDCFVGLAPMIVASGIQNKVIDYFSLRIPAIVSNNISKSFKLNMNDIAYFYEIDEIKWAKKIDEIFINHVNVKSMTDNAYNYVQEFHSWKTIISEYQKAIQKIEMELN